MESVPTIDPADEARAVAILDEAGIPHATQTPIADLLSAQAAAAFADGLLVRIERLFAAICSGYFMVFSPELDVFYGSIRMPLMRILETEPVLGDSLTTFPRGRFLSR